MSRDGARHIMLFRAFYRGPDQMTVIVATPYEPDTDTKHWHIEDALCFKFKHMRPFADDQLAADGLN